MSAARPRRAVLTVEGLEARALPSSTPLLNEAFQTAGPNGLPAGWVQWSADRSPAFRIDPTSGLGDLGELTATAPRGVAARAWVTAPFPADVETSASVYLNSLVPVQLFVRGKHLDVAPTYYAVSVTRGVQVELVRMVNGTGTVIGAARSGDYVSNKWVQVTLRAEGNLLKIQVRRGDSGRYLDSAGDWVSEPVNAVLVRDSAIASAGQVGFSRGTGGPDKLELDNLRVHQTSPESREVFQVERFDEAPGTTLPDGWAKWSGGPPGTIRTTEDQTFRIDGPSGVATRVWLNRQQPADLQVSSSLYVDSLVPAQLFARGRNLNSTSPTYYAASVTRGLGVQLVKVVNGRQTVLGELRSRDWISGQWLQVSLVAKGTELRVQVFRTDTSQYLKPDGTWGLAPSWALTRVDSGIAGGGYAGLGRGAGSTGALTFDNFIVTSAPRRWDEGNPIPTRDDKPTPLPPPPDGSTPPPAVPPTTTPPPPPTTTPGNPALPAVPRNLSWIRLANLAYYGTPLGSYEKALIRDAVDLVIPNLSYLDDIAAVSPTTPQFVYTNVSNIYLGMYTDWLEYADRNRMSREAAFYHATRPIGYAGMSASAVPVNRFWGAYRGRDGNWADLTSAARGASSSLAFGAAGESLVVGYTEKFREINVSLRSAAGGSWAAQAEYVTAVDSLGRPTAWARLPLNADGTGGLRRSGAITFDPPKNWVAASVNGSARLFYVRFRTTAGGTAPVALTILGRDYTNSRGGNSGTIPAFDRTADRDGDGYLNDAEYARRRHGYDARFVYESRLFYPNYGPYRFATNVSNPAFRAWAVDYHVRLSRTTPLASGFFVDNSIGRLAVDPATVAEGLGSYSNDYGSLLGAIDRGLGTKWLIANTAGGGNTAEPIIRNGVTYLEEFALRPLSANHVQFEDLAATLAYRRQLSGGRAYEILDSLPTNGVNATDPRLQVTTLAMYYMLADPNLSFLMMNGGNEPSSGWDRHWTNAIKFNVGKPTGTRSVFGTGLDPANRNLEFKVYARQYQNALVLYKPVSYTRGVSGTIADNTATTHALGGVYREVRADGTLGPAVSKITLRNGEGKILVRA